MTTTQHGKFAQLIVVNVVNKNTICLMKYGFETHNGALLCDLASYDPVTAAAVHAKRKRPHPPGGRGTRNTERQADRLTYVPSYGGWGTRKTVKLA